MATKSQFVRYIEDAGEGWIDWRLTLDQPSLKELVPSNGSRIRKMPFEHEAARLRSAARRGTIFYTSHAEVERTKDNIAKIDIANILCRCSVTLVETNKTNGEEEWRAEGKDGDGRKITVVVVVYEGVDEIKVITTWAK